MPIRVIPIWTVERNRSGFSASSSATAAPLSPASARVWSRARRAETTAISDPERTPFATIRRRTIRISIDANRVPSQEIEDPNA